MHCRHLIRPYRSITLGFYGLLIAYPFMAGLLITGLLITGPARAATIEEVVKLPVTVSTLSGQTVTRDVVITILRDDSRAKSPYLILNHGRSGVESERRGMGRATYRKQAEWFVAQGFAVFVPTRIGYGATGGEDTESTGSCSVKNYPAGINAAVEQIKAVARYAQTAAYITPHRGVIAGQSMGGISTIAASAQSVPGARAAINFSGGGGGDPVRSPEKPCRPDLLADTFAQYGRTSKIASLWLYSPNDRYWGPDLPKIWFARFKANGGNGQFVALPPFGNDGHRSFIGNSEAWTTPVAQFLKQNGFAPPAQ